MGRLVKGHGRVVPAAVIDARSQAQRLIETARAEAEAIRAEAIDLREQARREGFAAGRDAAQAEVTETLAAAREDAERLRAGARDAALALAVKMAEKIVARSVERDPAVLADIVGQALAHSRARAGTVTVRLHPDDLAAVDGERPRLTARLAGRVDLRLVADESVGRHGCVVETPAGRLDARLATQLAALERALADRRLEPGRG